MAKESDCRLWALKDLLLTEYHDYEWCQISHDDRYIFEMLCLEGQSVGLSDEYLDGLLEDPQLIRNKKKIYSVRNNAILWGTGRQVLICLRQQIFPER